MLPRVLRRYSFASTVKNKLPNFKDVAHAANVSFATVSRVATNSARVSPEILHRVKEAAQKLGVDLQRKNKAKVIGFILSNRKLLHPFHSLLLAGAEAYCTDSEYNTLFLPIHYGAKVPWRELQLPQILLRHDLVHGFILVGSNTQNLLDFLIHKRVRFAVLGNNMIGKWRENEYDVAWFDDVRGAYEMTLHLQALGHRDIWYVGNCRLPWFARRFEGYRQAMVEAGLAVRLSDIDGEKDEDVGYLATKPILNRHDRVTAVFAGSDGTAQGVYKALWDSGFRVPIDVSVAGFDDLHAAGMNPALTSVHVFVEQVGRQLAQMLMNRIANPDFPAQRQIVPTQLVKRESCVPIGVPDIAQLA
jgi:DNA-binding LacI/PurR family transcriptional regulator